VKSVRKGVSLKLTYYILEKYSLLTYYLHTLVETQICSPILLPLPS